MYEDKNGSEPQYDDRQRSKSMNDGNKVRLHVTCVYSLLLPPPN